MINAGGRQFPLKPINLLILFGIRKELPEEWTESINIPIYKNGDKQTIVIIEAYHFCQLGAKFITHPAVQVNSICIGNYWSNQCGFRRNRSTTDHMFYIRQILEKKKGIL